MVVTSLNVTGAQGIILYQSLCKYFKGHYSIPNVFTQKVVKKNLLSY